MIDLVDIGEQGTEKSWLVWFLEAALSRLKNCGIAVDVGANVGVWTAELAARFDRVIAVEPDDRASASIARPTNVELCSAVACDLDGEATLYMRPSSAQNSTLEVHPINSDPVIGSKSVRAVTLDTLCPSGADFVKIDVEGGEVAVLRGCSGDGRWYRTFFLVECHDKFAEVEAELVRLGKKVSRILHPSTGAHPGHCWASAMPDDITEPVVRA